MHWAFYYAIEKNMCETVEKLHQFARRSFFDLLLNKPILESLIRNDQ